MKERKLQNMIFRSIAKKAKKYELTVVFLLAESKNGK